MRIIEKNTDVRIKCYKCGNEYAMGMMRMAPDGKNLMCRNCLERKPAQRQEMPVKSDSKKQEEPATKEYFCKACKYSFERAKHLAITTCPYCDSGSLMMKGSTARIIADAFSMFFSADFFPAHAAGCSR